MSLSFFGTGFNLRRELCLCLPTAVFGAISTKFAVAKDLPGKSSFSILASVLLIREGSSSDVPYLF